eukprot:PLAT7098.2.p2 GENE.PLAT7098.2~~PLAT7098.2.p2  ORF type:complete len:540 (-),score=307.54 PLAT7098.2:71-1690(-)
MERPAADKDGSVEEEMKAAAPEIPDGPGFGGRMDSAGFRAAAHEMVDFIADYYDSLESKRVVSDVEPGYLRKELPEEAPEEGEEWADVMKDVREKIMPGVTHWQSPRFFAYFPANSSYPGMLGEMLSAAINCIGFAWINSPACTELETVCLDWLAKMLALPDCFHSSGEGGGVLHGTASEASATAMIAARQRACARLRPEEMAEDDFLSRLVVYTSEQAHFSIHKACAITGIPHGRFRSLPTREEDGYALQADVLRAAIEEDKAAGRVPFFFAATVGTTSTGAVDPLEELGKVVQEHDMYMHVDAAWAGAAAICPEFRPMLDGVRYAHSFNFNLHKWLLTNFDASAFFTREPEHLVSAMSHSGAYIEHKDGTVDYKDWQIPLGRRFRSLKLWFVMRTFGASGLRAHIRTSVKLAELFETLVKSDDRFLLATERTLGLVLFRLKERNDALMQALQDELTAEGHVFLVGTNVDGAKVLRFAVGSPASKEKHVREAWAAITATADRLLAEAGGAAAAGGEAVIEAEGAAEGAAAEEESDAAE